MWEHEQFSFDIKREDLAWLNRANYKYIAERLRQESIDQMAEHSSLKGKVYLRKTLSPKRLKGLGAFATTFGIYSYLPYIAVYTGPTAPILGACFAGLYGMFSFAESQAVNSIEFIKGGENSGKVLINVALSPFTSKNIIADVQDV